MQADQLKWLFRKATSDESELIQCRKRPGWNHQQDKATILEHSESERGIWDNANISNLEESLNDETTCQDQEYRDRFLSQFQIWFWRI